MIELVWDAERAATAVVPSGATVSVGDAAAFTPDDLVAVGASACLMRTFLGRAAAAKAPVLSYASTASFDRTPAARRLVIRSYVVTSSLEYRATLLHAFEQARHASPLCEMLGGAVVCEPDVRVVVDTGATA